jgi:antitoxin component HigA of HigAB toxin-antitoxin module
MKKAFKALTFSNLPADYAGLCGVLPPRAIRDQTDYENMTDIADAMALHDKEFSKDQSDYFETVLILIEEWDKKEARWPQGSGLETLTLLMAEHEMSAAGLSRLLGASRSLGAMVLRGERKITASHARTLGAHFNLSPGVFLE